MLPKTLLSICAFVIILLVSAIEIHAQPTGGGPGGGGPPVPISGIEILLGLGGALGLKKLIAWKQEKK